MSDGGSPPADAEPTYEELGLDVSLPPAAIPLRGGAAARAALARALDLPAGGVELRTAVICDGGLWLRVQAAGGDLALCIAPRSAPPPTLRPLAWRAAGFLAIGWPGAPAPAPAAVVERIAGRLDSLAFSDLLRAVCGDPDPSGIAADSAWLRTVSSGEPAAVELPAGVLAALPPRGAALAASPSACRAIAEALGLGDTVASVFILDQRLWLRVVGPEADWPLVLGLVGMRAEPLPAERFTSRTIGPWVVTHPAAEADSEPARAVATVVERLEGAEPVPFFVRVSEQPDARRLRVDFEWARETLGPRPGLLARPRK